MNIISISWFNNQLIKIISNMLYKEMNKKGLRQGVLFYPNLDTMLFIRKRIYLTFLSDWAHYPFFL